MSTINVKLYEILKNDLRLSDIKAKEFAEAIKEEVQNDIKFENSDFRSSMKEDFKQLELNIEKIKSTLELKIEQSKSETLKWFIGLFVALALMIIGLYIKK